MQTVVETDEYLRRAKQCKVTEEEREAIVDFIADHPMAGSEMAGTGGVRKVRFPKLGGGKSGGYRVITFYPGPIIPVFLLSVFAKSEKTNLSQGERNFLKLVMRDLVSAYKGTVE